MSSFPYLTVLVLVPAVAAVVLPIITSLVTPDSPAAERRVVQVVGLGRRPRHPRHRHRRARRNSHERLGRLPARLQPRLDLVARYPLDPRGRRHLAVPRAHDGLALPDRTRRRRASGETTPTFVAWLLLLEAAASGASSPSTSSSSSSSSSSPSCPSTSSSPASATSGAGTRRRSSSSTPSAPPPSCSSASWRSSPSTPTRRASRPSTCGRSPPRICPPPPACLLFLAFTAAFAVKAPIFPFHTWSPDAYRESPVAGTVILAGVMAKLGTYGIVRFDLELFPKAVVTLAPLLLTLGVIGIIYGGDRGGRAAGLEAARRLLVARPHRLHRRGGLRPHRAGAFAEPCCRWSTTASTRRRCSCSIAMIYRRSGSFSVRDLSGLQAKAPVLAGMFTSSCSPPSACLA